SLPCWVLCGARSVAPRRAVPLDARHDRKVTAPVQRIDESSAPRPRVLASAAWRIALSILPLGAGLAALPALLPAARDFSDPTTLALRIAAGFGLTALTIAVILCLIRGADSRRMRDAGLRSPIAGWRLAVWGALLWTVPAA